jgi:hypothetical protein
MSNSAGTSNRGKKDRRRAARMPVEAQGHILPCPASSRTTPTPVLVRDVSATGVGITHDTPLPVGAKFVVKQESFPPDQPRLYTVVRAASMPDGNFSIGLFAGQLGGGGARAAAHHTTRGHRHGVFAMVACVVIVVAAAALFLYKTAF